MKVKGMSLLLVVLCLSLLLLSPAAVGDRPSSPEGGVAPLMTANPGTGYSVIAALSPFSPVNAEAKEITKTYTGFLFTKLSGMCSKSERTAYYLQLKDNEETEIHVLGQGGPLSYVPDETLQSYLFRKVTIEGTETPFGFEYTGIKEFDCLEPFKGAGEEEFQGYLFSKLGAIGTRSEGTSYYLQRFDYSELHIKKDATLWQNDPKLHPLLNTKVTITGTVADGELYYTSIKPLEE